MATKFIYIITEEQLPEYGRHIVIDYSGRRLLSQYNAYSTPELFKSNYKYWLLEVPDVEENLKETLNETHILLKDSIDKLIDATKKIEEYQQQIKENREHGNKIQKSNDNG